MGIAKRSSIANSSTQPSLSNGESTRRPGSDGWRNQAKVWRSLGDLFYGIDFASVSEMGAAGDRPHDRTRTRGRLRCRRQPRRARRRVRSETIPPAVIGALQARQALSAAAACVRIARLRKDEEALRDAQRLAASDDNASPAGCIHLLWRLFRAPKLKGDAGDLAREGHLLGAAADRLGPARAAGQEAMNLAGGTLQGDAAETLALMGRRPRADAPPRLGAADPVAGDARHPSVLVHRRPTCAPRRLDLALDRDAGLCVGSRRRPCARVSASPLLRTSWCARAPAGAGFFALRGRRAPSTEQIGHGSSNFYLMALGVLESND